MYNEAAKKASMKYMAENREHLNINLPIGSKERYKKHAEAQGKSLTALIIELLEQDIKQRG